MNLRIYSEEQVVKCLSKILELLVLASMPSIGEQRSNKSHPLEQDLENMDSSSQIKCRGIKPLPLMFDLRKILI